MRIRSLKLGCGLALLVMLSVCALAEENSATNKASLNAANAGNKGPELTSSDDDVVATVAGQPIYEQDLAPALGSKLLQLRNQEYELKSQALDELIRKKVVEAEAKKRGISTDKLYEQEVDSKVPEPTDGEVEGYYLAVKSQLNQPLQEIKRELQKGVKLLKIAAARQDYADSLRAKADVAILLRPPTVEVKHDATRIKGDPKAPVTIVEFADFQCPYCKNAQPTLDTLLKKYQGQIKLAYRDFPLRTVHPQAQMAAEASRCAGEQGKFWEYHDALYADQKKLSQTDLIESARKLGLDGKSFESCLASNRFEAQIEEDIQEGTKAGVAGTPGFFINGVFLNGAQPAAEFEKIINRELTTIGKRNSVRASR